MALPFGLIASRRLPRRSARWLAYLVYIWLGAAFYFLVLLFSIDVARFLLSLVIQGWDELVAARAGAVMAAAGTAVATVSALRSAADIEVNEVEVGLERLPKELDGLTLVQLSDVHVGPTIGERFVRSIVEKTNALKPD